MIQVLCPVCGVEFPAANNILRHIARHGLKPKCCSRSCARKRMHQENPGLAVMMSALGKENAGRPSWNKGVECRPETKEKLSEIGLARKDDFLKIRRGNGTGMTPAEKLVSEVLPTAFIWNYPVPLGRRQEGYPTNYKLDFADPARRLGLEIDGVSHRAPTRQTLDRKKEDKLQELGWCVLRMSNETVFQMSSTSKLRDALTSLLGSAPP